MNEPVEDMRYTASGCAGHINRDIQYQTVWTQAYTTTDALYLLANCDCAVACCVDF